MAGTTKIMHNSSHAINLALTNAYGAATRHLLPLWNDSPGVQGNTRAVAHLSSLYVHVNTIAGGCTQLTVRLSRDTAGDQPWVGDTTATLSTGITTGTQGAITIKIDVDYVHTSADLYIHLKTTGGTCTADRVELVWEE